MVLHPAFFALAYRAIIEDVSLADEIKAKAVELGFDKAGIARAGALPREREHLEAWINNGFQGNMAWLEREPEKRSDPELLFPGTRSIVVCLLNYYTEHKHSGDASVGKISRYAWGDDYHDILKEKLNSLLSWIKEVDPSAAGKVCIDTAPFMDKAWAVNAGLGWIGKHSNLITKELGSWVFIGSLLLNIDLDPDVDTVDDHCGTCTRCIDACPTHAIVQPYVVDSRKCISYATIELRDETLPNEIRENLNGWVYGCDICQDVCPWNRFEQPTEEERFAPRSGETSLTLDVVEQMEHEEYVSRFRRSPMKRTKLAGLKRNAAALRSTSGGEVL